MACKDTMTIRLHLPGVKVLEVVEDLPERLQVAIVLIRSWLRCPRCQMRVHKVHETKPTRLKDLPISGRAVVLVWHKRRFRCPSCDKTTTETSPTFERKITTRLARAAVADCALMSVAAVARRYGLGWHQTMRLVGDWGAELIAHRRRMRVRVLTVDEKSLHKGHHRYATILVCGETGTVIAVLKGRSADVLAGWLAQQSPRWRHQVRVVATDMAACYRAGLRATSPGPDGRRLLPNAVHVADRFHVIRNFLRVLTNYRRQAQATPKGEPHDPELFRARFLLLKRWDRLSADENARLGAMLAKHPELSASWQLVQRFHAVLEADDIAAALRRVADFVDDYQHAGINLGSAVRTFLRWSDETLAYHRTGGWTTNVSEGVNCKIELLERIAYGFANNTNYTHRVALFCSGHPNQPTIKTAA